MLFVVHGLEQQAVERIVERNGRAAVAALEDRSAAIQRQARLKFLCAGAVAFKTMADQQRADLRFEKLNVSLGGRVLAARSGRPSGP